MATTSNNVHKNMAKIVKFAHGDTTREIERYTIVDSAAIYLGSLVTFITGTIASPTGSEYGVVPFTDDRPIFGIAVGFNKYGSSLSIFNDSNVAGTITNATSILPAKYTASASNDKSNSTRYLEQVQVLPIMPGDVLEMVLLADAGTSTVNRAAVTAGSDMSGMGFSVNATSPFGLTESTASTTLTNLDFISVEIKGEVPRRPDAVYAECIRKAVTLFVAD